ncbi:MAG: nitrilase-related carbon-nitrogen hydrolase [bacterium]
MSFDADTGKKFWGVFINILLVVISGVLASLVFPPHGWWWCGWFAMVPLFVALRRTKEVRASSWLMLLFGIVFFAFTLPWLYKIFAQGVLGIYILVTLPWLLFAVAYRVTGMRCPGIWTVLLAAVLWVGTEWVRCEGWYFNFSWAQLGFGFINSESFTPIYKYIGVFGCTFLVILVNAALAEIILLIKLIMKRERILAFAIAIFIVGCLIVPFYINDNFDIKTRVSARPGRYPRFSILWPFVESGQLLFYYKYRPMKLGFFKNGHYVSISNTFHYSNLPTTLIVQDESSDLQKMQLLTNDIANDYGFTCDRKYMESLPGLYHESDIIGFKLRKEIKPNIIVWPELAVNQYPLSDYSLLSDLRQVSRDTDSVLVLGCKEKAPADAKVDWLRRRAIMSIEGSLFYNTALIIDSDGKVVGTYHKTHPIQFFSDGVPGGMYPTFQTKIGRIGVAICYDFDYASTNVNLVKNGAEVLVVPTYDAIGWTALQHTQHSQMAQARAAEVSRWVLRSTSSGISQIIRPDGSLEDSIPNGASSSMIGFFEKRNEITPYMRGPYLLPYICFGIGTLWGIWLLWLMYCDWKRRKTEKIVSDINI